MGFQEIFDAMMKSAEPLIEKAWEYQKEQRAKYYKPQIDEYRNQVERSIAKSGMSNSTYALRERQKAEDNIQRLLAGDPSGSGFSAITNNVLSIFGTEWLKKQDYEREKDRMRRYKNWYYAKSGYDWAKKAGAQGGMMGNLSMAAALGGTGKGIPLDPKRFKDDDYSENTSTTSSTSGSNGLDFTIGNAGAGQGNAGPSGVLGPNQAIS